MSALALPWRKEKEKAAKPELPAPLVTLRHPITWTKHKTILGIAGAIGTHVGTLIVVALYYLFIGAKGYSPLFHGAAPLTGPWHSAVPDDNTRHMYRAVAEGVLGGTLGQMVIYNAFRKVKAKAKLSRFDKIEIRLHIPNSKDTERLRPWQILAFPLFITLYALPGFFLGTWFMDHVVHSATTLAAASTGNQNYAQMAVTSEWQAKIVGLFASVFMGRRVIKAYANDVQEWFAERRICLDKPVRWYHTPVFKARYNDMMKHGVPKASMSQGGLTGKLMVGGTFIGVCLAGFGFYVIDVIAKR